MRRLLLPVASGLVLAAVFVCVSRESSVQAQSEPAGRKLAFLVGVKTYNHSQLKTLDYPERDVEEFAPVLRRSGYTVVLLTTAEGLKTPALMPTAANIQSQLEKLLANVTRQDMILVGLAGHGIQPLGSDSAYFCPKDANPTTVVGMATSPSRPKFPATLLGIDALLQTLDESGIGRKLVLMDACRNDPGVRGRRGVDRVKVSALPQETGVLLSCSPGQFAFEHKNFGGGHGAFFHHVIEGFKGKAVDAEEEGVTWESLVKFVGKRVPVSVKAQYGALGGEQRPNLIANLPVETVLLAKASTKPSPTLPEPSYPLNAPAEDVPDDVPASKPLPKSKPLSQFRDLVELASKPLLKNKPLSPADFLSSDTPEKSALVSGTKAGQEWSGNGLRMRFCWCPPGKFTMGSPKDEAHRAINENQVQVTLTKGFWLGKYEVTQGEWKRLMETSVADLRPDSTHPLRGEGDMYPMYYVSHDEAAEFCKKLTRQEQSAGRLPSRWVYQLPSEAQWEYGCRSGTTTATAFGTRLDSTQANFDGKYPYNGAAQGVGKAAAVPVGSYIPNAWGLYDMHGNVSEWCADWYAQELPGGSNPLVVPNSSGPVARGGSWGAGGVLCRSASRGGSGGRSNGLGFRVAAVQLSQ